MSIMPNNNIDHRNYLPQSPRYKTEQNILAYNDNIVSSYSSIL